MGARWPWEAWCTKGHRSTGFSGGSDGVCGLGDCNEPVVKENELPFYEDEPSGESIPDPLITRLRIQQAEIATLREKLAAVVEVIQTYPGKLDEDQFKVWIMKLSEQAALAKGKEA